MKTSLLPPWPPPLWPSLILVCVTVFFLWKLSCISSTISMDSHKPAMAMSVEEAINRFRDRVVSKTEQSSSIFNSALCSQRKTWKFHRHNSFMAHLHRCAEQHFFISFSLSFCAVCFCVSFFAVFKWVYRVFCIQNCKRNFFIYECYYPKSFQTMPWCTCVDSPFQVYRCMAFFIWCWLVIIQIM